MLSFCIFAAVPLLASAAAGEITEAPPVLGCQPEDKACKSPWASAMLQSRSDLQAGGIAPQSDAAHHPHIPSLESHDQAIGETSRVQFKLVNGVLTSDTPYPRVLLQDERLQASWITDWNTQAACIRDCAEHAPEGVGALKCAAYCAQFEPMPAPSPAGSVGGAAAPTPVPPPPNPCNDEYMPCSRYNARCLACNAGKSVQEFCEDVEALQVPDCPETLLQTLQALRKQKEELSHKSEEDQSTFSWMR